MLPWSGHSLPVLITGFAGGWYLWLLFGLTVFPGLILVELSKTRRSAGGISCERLGFAALTRILSSSVSVL